ncbi:MAG: RagB/SusD family nutrient uptake outer membrane protein, partial [Bacteroidales bacterium]
MKYTFLYLILSTLLFGSCVNELLDTKPYDKYTEELIWNDEKLAQGFIYNTQNAIISEYMRSPLESSNFSGASNDDFSDNILILTNLTPIADISRDIMSVDKDYGWGSFDLIRQANLIIERSQASTEIKPDRIAYLVAQGKMLRAMIYFKKAKLFGKYIILNRVLTPTDEFQIPRSKTIKETYDFIIEDLKAAALDLPETGALGSLTKGAAYAMCAEVALQAASFAETNSTEYFELAKEMSENLFALTEASYALDSDYRKLFNDFDYAQASKEIILGWFKSQNNTTFKDCHMLQNIVNIEFDRIHDFAMPRLVESFLGNGKRTPSLDLVNEYEVIDEDGLAKKWNQTSYYKNFVPGQDYVSGVFFKNRDMRFYASIVYDST